MVIAGHHSLLPESRTITGCHLLMHITADTGLSITFVVRRDNTAICATGRWLSIDWGDGSEPHVVTYVGYTEDLSVSHTYPDYGYYDVVLNGVCQSIGFATQDTGSSTFSYSKAPVSIVDYSGVVFGSQSAAFRSAVNLETLVLPWTASFGQRDFAYCTKLRTVEIGCPSIFYDGVFQGCTALTSFKVNYDSFLPRWREIFTTWTDQTFSSRACECWHSVWNGCSSVYKLNVGHIGQFGRDDFTGCTNLTDVYVTNHTAAEIKNNFGKSYAFPWGAGSSVKFHGTDGYVLGDGTIVT